MNTATNSIVITAAMLFIALSAPYAQARGRVGTGAVFSMKECGVTLVFPSNDRRAPEPSIDLVADLGGVLFGGAKMCGGAIRFTDNFFFGGWPAGDNDTFVAVYAGPGAMAGYVRDYPSDRYGPVAAFSVNAGIISFFKRFPLRISVGFGADLGVVFGKGKGGRGTVLRFYKNGVFRSYYPEIKLVYAF